MDMVADRPPLTVSVWWRFGLALLFGMLVSVFGGLVVSALSQGLLLAALLARPVFHLASLRTWWREAPSRRVLSKDNSAVSVLTALLLLPVFIWEAATIPGQFLGLGSPALLLGLTASILFGVNKTGLKAFWQTSGFGVAAGLGAFLAFGIAFPASLLTFQRAAVILLLAAGGGILGALIWLFVGYLARPSAKVPMTPPENFSAPEPGATTADGPFAARCFSRRVLLTGALKGAGLLAVGAGMAWITRAIMPQFVPLSVYRGHKGYVQVVAWSPDGRVIASAGDDYTVQLWKPFQPSAPVLTYRGHTKAVASLAWSPDGKHIVSTSFDDTTQVWNAHTGAHLLTYPKGGNCVAWSPDGPALALASYRDNNVYLIEARTGRTLLTSDRHSNGGVNAVAWSPDSQRLASGGGDLTVQVWERTTGITISIATIRQIVYAVAWSPDGTRMVSANDGTLISVGSDQTVTRLGQGPSAQIFDASTGREVLRYTGHHSIVETVVWSPDGKQIATGGGDIEENDNSVQVWSASDGSLIARYEGHQDQHDAAVFSLAWSPNGRWIASASADQTVQIWQPE